MIKWKQYQMLTEHEKDEYRFRFQSRKLPVPFTFSGLAILWLAIQGTMFALYLFSVEESLADSTLQMTAYYMWFMAEMTQLYVIIILVTVLIFLCKSVYYSASEYFWLRKRRERWRT